MQPEWEELSLPERCGRVRSFNELARSNSEDIAHLIALETGRPITSARVIVAWGIQYFEAYLEMADKYLSPQITFQTASEIHRIYREPWGVVGCITPWNFPFLNVPWQCGQALIAGNTIVYKNSEKDPLFGQLLADLIDRSDLPSGVFNVLHGDGQVGRWILESDIDLISFTGSTKTGQEVAKLAAKKFIPYVAELGGSDSCIVCEDADINSIIDTIYHNRFDNAGQSCNAIKRLIVHKLRFEEVVEKLRVILDRTKIGPALDPEVEIGPLVSRRQLDLIESQVQEAIDQGAQIASGGRRPENLQGGYYLPTLLTDVRTDMRVWREETFGPVLPIVSFSTEQEAIALANDTQYGLGAWVMTEDHDRFRRISRRLQSGMVTENNVNYLSSQNPFGGYKKSGMGRTHGEFGFHEVTQVKLVSSRQ